MYSKSRAKEVGTEFATGPYDVPKHASFASGSLAKLYRVGLVTHRVPVKGFEEDSTSRLLSQAFWAQGCRASLHDTFAQHFAPA